MPYTEYTQQKNSLNFIAKSDLTQYFDSSKITSAQIALLCRDLSDILRSYGNSSTNLQTDESFFKCTVPVLVEVLLRRKSLRENGVDIQNALKIVVDFLSLPDAWNVVELCELRNLLLLGSNAPNFKFISAKMVGSSSTSNSNDSSGYFVDFGRPAVCVSMLSTGYKSIPFWADNWKTVLGGSQAINHFLHIFVCVNFLKRSGFCEVTGGECDDFVWIGGCVSKYEEDSDMHTIDIDDSMFPANISSTNAVGGDTDVVRCVRIDLSSTRHLWVDLENKHKMAAVVGSDVHLSFSSADIGHFVRMFWSKYDKHFYARVSSFDSKSGQHTLLYEDGDTRRYDLHNRTDCEVLSLPPDLVEALSHRRLLEKPDSEASVQAADVFAAKEVAKWHAQSLTVDECMIAEESNLLPSSSMSSSSSSLWLPISRPDAFSSPVTFSECQAALINLFVSNGGLEIVFDLFLHKDIKSNCKIIALYLQLVYQLTRTWKSDLFAAQVFRAACWDAKEVAPQALLRMNEAQIKDMQVTELNEVYLFLRDLLQILSGSDTSVIASNQQRDEIHLSIEMTRMAMAAKLLASGQLQKRYLGLSTIKDAIDSTLPKVTDFVLRRTKALAEQRADVSVLTVRVCQPFQLQSGVFRSSISTNSLDWWLTHNRVFETVFGESLHQELAAKGDVLLAYFAHRRLLTESHVEMLWVACTRGAHEAVVRVIHHLIILVVPLMQSFLRSYLFSLMASVHACDYTEQLLSLIKSFTVQVLQANRDDMTKGSSESDKCTQLVGGTKYLGTKGDGGGRASLSRKGHVINAPQRQWLGFGVLWQFVQDPVLSETTLRVDEELVESAVRLLVELLEVEFSEEREEVMQRCLDNVRRGLSVTVSLQILRRVLTLYPVTNKNWYSGIVGRPSHQANKDKSVSLQIERLIEQHSLLGIVFDDLNSYHNSFVDGKDEGISNELLFGMRTDQQEPIVEKAVVGRVGRMSHIRGVGERLDFLRFIVSHSNIRLSEAQTMILWSTFGEGALSGEMLDRLCDWLDSLVTRDNCQLSTLVCSLASDSDLSTGQSKLSFLVDPMSIEESNAHFMSVFDEGVVVHLFEEGVLNWAFRPDKVAALSRPTVARLCMKLFLLANINNRSLRVESTVPWYRAGQLRGLPLLWRIAMDATDEPISSAAITLLVELHHRMPSRLKATDSIRGSFLRLCFKHLYLAIQSVHVDDLAPTSQCLGVEKTTSNDVVTGKTVPQVRALGDWFDDGCVSVTTAVISVRVTRLISTVHLFVQRFYLSPSPLHSLRILAGRNESQVLTLVLRSSDTVGFLRDKISKYLSEATEDILLTRVHLQSSSFPLSAQRSAVTERLDKNELTLGQLRFSAMESVVVRKVNSASPSSNGPDTGSSATDSSAAMLSDALTPQGLHDDSGQMDPIGWLNLGQTYHLFHAAPFHLPSHMSLRASLSDPPSGIQPHLVIEDNEQEFVEAISGSDGLYMLVRHHPLYVDQLLEMLDGYLSTHEEEEGIVTSNMDCIQDLSPVVWEILQLLPTQSALLEKVRDAITETNSTAVALLLGVSSSYRLLYTLQIIESMLSEDEKSPIAAIIDVSSSLLSKGVQGSETKAKLPSTSTSNSRWTAAEWAAKFFLVGGVDCIVTLMRSEIANILSTGKRHQSSGRQRSESACYSAVHLFLTTTDSRRSIKRSDKSVVLLALLSRILHRVLLLDGAYSGWQADEPCEDCGIPMGVIVSCVDTPQLVRALFDVSTMISEFQSCGVITATAFRVFAEDGLRLLFGLLASADDGGQIVRQQSLSLSEWIVQMSVRNECFFSRGIVVWRIFELCANLSNRCTDGCFANDGKPSRVDLLNFIIDSVKVCCGMGGSVETNHLFEQLYSLMAGLLWLSGTQHQSRIAHISGDGDMSISNKDKRLVEHFVSRLVLHNSSETFHSAAVDGTLRGLLRVLLVLASKGSSMCSLLGRTEVPFVSGWEGRLDLVKHLYSRCLFPQNDRFADAPPLETLKTVYQTADSRRLATTLLLRLCDCDPLSLSRLLQVANGLDTDLAVSHTSNFSRKCLHQWNYDPNQLAREVGAQVGLSNQGGTCYMNAFLQQLYHIPSFVDGLLAINRTSSNDLSENEAMLFQLQVMFGSMRLSQRRYYDTLPFCRSFIDYDGQPVNLGEQKDINEFAGMLFDKLEHNKDCAALLADTLQGTMVWKTRSTESAYRSEREEPFYMITVEVKDKGSLEGSLELTVAEELFSGDNRIEDSDGRKVEALRRCAIRQLPPTLIVHLKRFEFDLETMHRKKVNDRISFPTKLDMFPYTEQGLATKELLLAVGGFGGPEVPNRPTDEFQYSLKGVVAHVGAIDRGHYYSFIKSDGLQGVEAEWREYNDRSVLPFSSESLERECFGGADDSTGTEQPSRVRENSAYLLIYERVSGLMCSEALSLPGFRDVDSPVTERSVIVRRPKKSRPVIIAEAVEAAVWRANMQFQTDRFLFDSINIQFILQLLHVGGRHPQLDGSLNIDIPAVVINCFPLLVMTGLRLVLEVVVRARVRKFVHMYFSRLEEIILADSQTGKSAEAVIDELTRADIDNSSWLYPGGLLSGQSSGGQSKYQVVLDATQRSCHPWLLEMMMYCPHGEAALSFSRVLITCVKVLRPFQNASYLLKIEGQHVSSISKLVCCLMVLLEKLLPDDAGRKDGYKLVAMVLHQFAALGDEECSLLRSLGGIYRVVCSVLSVNPSANGVDCGHLRDSIDLVALLVKSCVAVSISVSDSNSPVLASLFSLESLLQPEDVQAFLNRVFLEEAILVSSVQTSMALQHVCYLLGAKEGLRVVEFLVEKVLECTSASGGTSLQYRPYFKVVSDIMLNATLVEGNDLNGPVGKLMSKAFSLSARPGGSDAELIYAVCKLCHRIGTCSISGHVAVLQMREFWRDIGLRVGNAKRLPSSSIGSSASHTNVGQASAVQGNMQ